MKRILPLFLALVLFPLVSLADGGVYPATAIQSKTTIPGQRALLVWSNGVERLAIDTRFIGEGTNFAWVVPLPSAPVIEPATPGLFTTLDYIFRPDLTHLVFPFYAILLFCTGVGYLLLNVRRNTEPRNLDTFVSLATALILLPFGPCFAIPLAVLLPWSVWRVRTGKEGLWLVILVLFFLLIMSGMLLPALGTAGTATAAADGVTILNQERIGAYDTTTLTSKDSDSLLHWLDENNFAAPRGVEGAVSNYVKQGWVFVASKLHRTASGSSDSSPEPLCFTFRASKPIYPMQLTGIGNTNLAVELFVFGPSRAEANFFKVDRCATPIFSDVSFQPRNLRIVHPTLQEWTAHSEVATRLVANLTPEQMKTDVELQWQPFTEFHRTVYSGQGAFTFSLNWGAVLFCGTLLLGCIITLSQRNQRSALKLIAIFAAVVGVTTTVALFISLPKTEVRLVRYPPVRSRMNLNRLSAEYFYDLRHGSSPEEARERISKMAATNENVLLGGFIREEESPGNYILQKSTNDFDFVSFDRYGGAHTNL